MSYVKKIKSAFPVSEPPHVLLKESTSAEGEEDNFQSKYCANIDDFTLENSTFILLCFTPQAFVYYLPRFMQYAFLNPKSAVAEAVVDRVLPQENGELRRSFQDWWSLLNSMQKNIVLELVDLYLVNGGDVLVGRLDTLRKAVSG